MTKISFLGSSSPKIQTPPPLQVLSIQASVLDKKSVLVSQIWRNEQSFPLFSYKGTEKFIQLTRIGAGSSIVHPTPIGDVKFHSWHDDEFTFLGQSLSFKERDGIGGWKLDSPEFGKLKFYDNEEKAAYILKDSRDTRIARYRSGPNKGPIGGAIEILVPINDHFLDLIVLFTIAMAYVADDLGADLKETAANFKKEEHIIDSLGGGGQ